MTSQKNNEYIPGMCNIGPAERRKRRIGGIAGAVGTILLLIVLIVIDAPVLWRLILIIPATGAAIEFLQDALHFCVGFGVRGIYNVLNSTGITDNVEQESYRQKDRRKAWQIVGLSFVIGLAFSLLTLLI